MHRIRKHPVCSTRIRSLGLALAAAMLGGCGVEVATTTATTANLAAAQAQQAKTQQAQVVDRLEAAQDADASRPVGD